MQVGGGRQSCANVPNLHPATGLRAPSHIEPIFCRLAFRLVKGPNYGAVAETC